MIKILTYLPVVEAIPYFILFHFISALRMFHTKSSNDVSIFAQSVGFFVQGLYIFYGFYIVKEWQFISSTALATFGNGLVLGVAIYYRIKNKKR